MELFTEIALIVFIATLCALLMRIIRQPLIMGYILAGILAGPYAINTVRSTENIELFSKIGITILLFIVGLNLNPKVIRDVGKSSLIAGLAQIFFTTVTGYGVATFLGLDRTAAFYVAFALTLSSTIVILKLLSDKNDLNKLYGKITLGMLLVQDVAATIALLFISTTSDAPGADVGLLIFALSLKTFAVALTLYILTVYVVPYVVTYIATSAELLFLFSLTWGLGLASLFYWIGFSVEIGALIAGVMLSMTPYAYEISARLKPLRDFFIVLFFILLGSQMQFANIASQILPAIVLSLFVLIGNPIIVIIIMNLIGYGRKTGFMAGLAVAQISEFSLILATLGFDVGHISSDVLSLITLIALITIGGSTYLILYAESIYPRVENIVKYFELRSNLRPKKNNDEDRYEAVLFGHNRVGNYFISSFEKLKKPYIVVDYDPETIKQLGEKQIPHRFGDASDLDFLSDLNLDDISIAISTIQDINTNILLTRTIRKTNKTAVIMVMCQDMKESQKLYKSGATYVMMPHYLGARYASQMLSRLGPNHGAFDKERHKHFEHIGIIPS